jgi:hypothetical protein
MEESMKFQVLLPLILVGAGFAYVIAMNKKRGAGMGEALRRFLERTGYRYADVPQPELEHHVARGEAVFKNLGKGYQARMIRNFHGLIVHNVQEGHATNDGWAMSCSWLTPLSRGPRVLLHIADRSLSGAGKAIKEAFSRQRRHWQPIYPYAVPIADPELNQRLVCYSTDPAAAQHVLNAPGMKELLLGCAEVDLAVLDAEVRFSDPFQKNLLAGMGGTFGRMAMGSDMNKAMDLQIPVHDRIAQLLGVTVRAVS